MRWRRAAAISAAVVVGLGMLSSPAVAVDAPATRASVPRAPSAADGGGIDARAAQLVERMSTAEQAASVVMGHIPTTDPTALASYMQQGFGGFILMGANVPEDGDVTAVTEALVTAAEPLPLVAIDQEGGIVSRLGADTYPASTSLKTQPVAATSAAFAARAALVARSGIDVNFGTVADVPADSASFIFGRALGADPQSAAERVAAATTAQEPVVASTLKHFPGHGAAPGDSHHAIPSTTETLDEWRATDAVPFAAGVDAGASLLMFGHLAYTAVDAAPASLSPAWHEIARDELGFDGVIVTDDLGMLSSSGVPAYADPVANAVTALAAGSDLLLMIAGSTPDTAGQIAAGITAAVEAGTVPEDRLVDAATRVMALRLQHTAATAEWTLCPECEPVG
ncbi:glycosyl hydrolase family 3 [Microbacterium sp. SZ1]|uniref:glycoside hydrolase family 3 N-terminal domain-containing protein n=1 Tax=Microbacterium sp. SZ1 TaxID=1849736 RepID=UPI000BCE8E4B|nr:glycoside hydrolase family 3 N-terminal domain-containing protein [Microbacterium sp. SZ1]PCE14089.1 glycosyl hydrolase family 3 [Microbacterium sp. SZ1]